MASACWLLIVSVFIVFRQWFLYDRVKILLLGHYISLFHCAKCIVSDPNELKQELIILHLIRQELTHIIRRTALQHWGSISIVALAPGKPIIANRGIDYIPRLNSAPESTIKTNLRINYFLNLTHLARTVNSLIGGKSLSKQTKWRNDCSRERKFQQREIDLEQLTGEEPSSRYIVQVWPRVNHLSI